MHVGNVRNFFLFFLLLKIRPAYIFFFFCFVFLWPFHARMCSEFCIFSNGNSFDVERKFMLLFGAVLINKNCSLVDLQKKKKNQISLFMQHFFFYFNSWPTLKTCHIAIVTTAQRCFRRVSHVSHTRGGADKTCAILKSNHVRRGKKRTKGNNKHQSRIYRTLRRALCSTVVEWSIKTTWISHKQKQQQKLHSHVPPNH